MTYIYFTAKMGRKNANGHRITRGHIFMVKGERLDCLGAYSHQSGGAHIYQTIEREAKRLRGGLDENGKLVFIALDGKTEPPPMMHTEARDEAQKGA